jgi:hypothetical protein
VRLLRRGPQAFEPSEYSTHFAPIPPRHGRFHPLLSLLGVAVWRLGHAVQRVGTVIVVQNLTSAAQERLDVLPYPRGPIADHTKPHAICGNQIRFFDDFEGRSELRFMLNLVPTE